jgi:hypothetical protein
VNSVASLDGASAVVLAAWARARPAAGRTPTRFTGGAITPGAYDQKVDRVSAPEGSMGPTLRVCLLLPLLSGCAAAPPRVECYAPPVAARGVVFVIDGAGGPGNAGRSLSAAVAEAGLPLGVRVFHWGHGWGLGLADVLDVGHSRRQGARLAEEVRRCQAARPDLPVSLVAYSAGTAVALAAAERLPPDSLACVVLLAPAVSAGYDLRPALVRARGGIDVFTSERDRFWLGVGTAVVGTADGRADAAAGRVGFRPPALCPAEAALAGRLRQHPWDPCVAWTGHEGGHAGSLRLGYLRAYVLPLLAPPR